MQILNLKKYVFSYVYIVLGILFICALLLTLKFEPPYIPNNDPTNFQDYRVYPYTIIMIVSLYFYLISFGALLIEIFLRNMIIFFSKRKQIVSTYKKPTVLTVIFYTLFTIASIPLILFLIFSLLNF